MQQHDWQNDGVLARPFAWTFHGKGVCVDAARFHQSADVSVDRAWYVEQCSYSMHMHCEKHGCSVSHDVLLVCVLDGAENPTSQPRMKFGEYPQHFVIGKTKLFLGLISGEKLRDIQSFGTQDPYCEVFLSKRRNPSAQDLVYKSKTHNNGGACLSLFSVWFEETTRERERLRTRLRCAVVQAKILDGWKRLPSVCDASSTISS